MLFVEDDTDDSGLLFKKIEMSLTRRLFKKLFRLPYRKR